MKYFFISIFCWLSFSTMAQLENKDLIGSYSYNKIASGDQARMDHANYYHTLQLSKDGTFLWTKKQGRLSANFHYQYGSWIIEEDCVVLNLELEAYDLTTYRKTNKGYHQKPAMKVLKGQKESGRYCAKIKIEYASIRGLEYKEVLYKKVKN